MKNFRLFLFLFCMSVLLPHSVFASTFQIHFQYDKASKRLDFDTTTSAPVTIDPSGLLSPIAFYDEEASGPFTIAFTDFQGEEIVKKSFDPTVSSRFTFDTPYYSFAKKVEVYRAESTSPILSHDLTALAQCNQNSMCELERGETNDTCLADCSGASVEYSPETKSKLDESNGVIRDQQTGNVILNTIPVEIKQDVVEVQTPEPQKALPTYITIIATVIFLIALGSGVYFIVKKW